MCTDACRIQMTRKLIRLSYAVSVLCLYRVWICFSPPYAGTSDSHLTGEGSRQPDSGPFDRQQVRPSRGRFTGCSRLVLLGFWQQSHSALACIATVTATAVNDGARDGCPSSAAPIPARLGELWS